MQSEPVSYTNSYWLPCCYRNKGTHTLSRRKALSFRKNEIFVSKPSFVFYLINANQQTLMQMNCNKLMNTERVATLLLQATYLWLV